MDMLTFRRGCPTIRCPTRQTCDSPSGQWGPGTSGHEKSAESVLRIQIREGRHELVVRGIAGGQVAAVRGANPNHLSVSESLEKTKYDICAIFDFHGTENFVLVSRAQPTIIILCWCTGY